MIRDCRGLAALEFALIVPFLVMMVVGSAELVHYIRTRDMFYTAVASLADIVASEQGVTPTGTTGAVSDACTGARTVLVNDPQGAFAAAVVSVTNYSSTGVTYDWEVDKGCLLPPTTPPTPPVGQAPQVGATAAISAAGPMVPNVNDSVIMVQAQSTYVPYAANYVPYLAGVFQQYTFHATLFSRPRYGQVICTGCTSSS